MTRHLEPELLDQLPPDDPRARRSRRDLRRLNCWMGNARLVARALENACPEAGPASLVDLGAGDGDFLLQVARWLARRGRKATATLLDRQAIASAETRRAFEALGWRVETVAAEVSEWSGVSPGRTADAAVANLFLHHFGAAQLAELFRRLAVSTHRLVACEPRRSRGPLLASRLLGLLGCNAVTRHDAPVSVRAGFTGRELSSLWPDQAGWRLTERRAGWFSHLFVAKRNPH